MNIGPNRRRGNEVDVHTRRVPQSVFVQVIVIVMIWTIAGVERKIFNGMVYGRQVSIEVALWILS